MQYTDEEILTLNSNAALNIMLQQEGDIDLKRVIRYVNYENELESLQVKLLRCSIGSSKIRKEHVSYLKEGTLQGKGGAIRRIIHHLNPRNYRVVALHGQQKKRRAMVFSTIHQ